MRTSPDNSLDLVPLASREGFGGDEQKVGAEKQDRLRSFTYFWWLSRPTRLNGKPPARFQFDLKRRLNRAAKLVEAGGAAGGAST
jgi:hypothetical protein